MESPQREAVQREITRGARSWQRWRRIADKFLGQKETKLDHIVVEIFTDGACSGNPGPGGWAAIIRKNGTEEELTGGEPATTNQRMELMPAIVALSSLNSPSKVRLYSDSQYLIKGMNEWIEGWKSRGWRKSNNKPVENPDLWKRLDAIAARHQVEWIKVKGHDNHPENERADRLAVQAIERFRN